MADIRSYIRFIIYDIEGYDIGAGRSGCASHSAAYLRDIHEGEEKVCFILLSGAGWQTGITKLQKSHEDGG